MLDALNVWRYGSSVIKSFKDKETERIFCGRFSRKLPQEIQRLGIWEHGTIPHTMDYEADKVDEAVLALLYLTLHDGARAWKSFDWEAMNRLHEKGYIANPIGKAKSVVFTEEGLKEAEGLFKKLFGKQ